MDGGGDIGRFGEAAFFADAEGVFDGGAELEGEGFAAEDFVSAGLGCFDNLGGGGEVGGENDLAIGAVSSDLLGEFEAREGLEEHVANDDADVGFFDDFGGFGGIIAAEDLEIFRGEVLAGPLEEIVIEIDEEEDFVDGWLIGRVEIFHWAARVCARWGVIARKKMGFVRGGEA